MTWNGGLTFLLIERVADCRQRVVPLLRLPQRIVGRPGEGLKAASDSCIAAHFQVPNDSRDTHDDQPRTGHPPARDLGTMGD